jgi:adenine-specific DNA-methyltransferase
MIKKFGQYFTKDSSLQNKVVEFIKNNPSLILEPSVGQGHLVKAVRNTFPSASFDCYEIDEKLNLIVNTDEISLTYCDFLTQSINKKYNTIIGNPPYVKTKHGNLYIDFIEKCINLLDDSGELIFIVPSDFFKLTSASSLINSMLNEGKITHVYHPHNENLFEHASIDVIVFRYEKTNLRGVSPRLRGESGRQSDNSVLYNDSILYLNNSNGIITFSNSESSQDLKYVSDYFNVYVGMVSGKDSVFQSSELGNINVLTDENHYEKFIYYEDFPSLKKTQDYLLNHKDELISRKIKKFNENNWWKWGAPRNISTIKKNFNKKCIYIKNLTRNKTIAFIGNVTYFSGSLLLLIPINENINLDLFVNFFNSDKFKFNYMYSQRFKIGHKQLCNSVVPSEILN